MPFHRNLTLEDIHSVAAKVYADVTARDADTDFNTDSDNLNKLVRLDSPVSYYILTAVTPSWLEFSSESSDSFIELTDTPSTYSGSSLQAIRVNAAETGLEFSGAGAGDVVGPAGSVDGALAFFNGVTGLILEDAPGITTDGIDLAFAEDILLTFGDLAEFTIQHDGTSTIFTTVAGNTVFDNQNAIGTFDFDLGTDDENTGFRIRNDTGNVILETRSDGTVTTLKNFLGDILIESGSGGEFLFGADEFRSGHDDTEYLSIGHIGTFGFINSVGNGELRVQHDGVTQFIIKDDFTIEFAVAGSIETVTGDLTLAPGADGNVVIDALALNLVDAPIKYLDGSTQYIAAVPDLHTGRISSAAFNHAEDVSTQDAAPQGMYIRADGIKLYVAGDITNSVIEYDLSIPWDTSSKTFLQSFSVVTQDSSPRDVFFKPDGLVMFVCGTQNDSVYQYNLSAAWDISTASFDDAVSVLTDGENPHSLTFTPDGESFFVAGLVAGRVARYSMSSRWDVGSASFADGFVPAEPTNVIGASFRSDGALMYIASSTDDAIYEYFLGTPWDITVDPEFLRSIDVGVDGSTAMRGVFFSTLHHKMYFPENAVDSIFEYDMGLIVEGLVQSYGDAIDIINVYRAADIDDLAVAGVVTIAVDTTLHIKGDVSTDSRFSIDDGITLHIVGENNATAKLTYTGAVSTDFFSGEGAIRIFGLKNLDAAEVGDHTLFNLTGGGTINIRDTLNLTGWQLGSSNGQFFGIDSVFVDLSSGMTLTNPTLVNVTDFAVEGTTFGGAFFTINTNDPASIINFTDVSGLSLSASGALFEISSKSNNNARYSIRNCKVAKDAAGDPVGHIFEPQTSGSDEISAVADGSPATGSITAQAANGFGGTRHSCTTTYFDDEEVTITGTTSYNGTFQISNVVAGVSFDTITNFVANDATGSVDSDRLDLTVATNSTFVGDAIKIADTNFYNGFYTVLDKPDATSLIVNGIFISTNTGNYSDGGGIDQSDPRVSSIGNSPFVDSHFIACAHVNDNSTANGAIVNNTFTDMVFGTVGDAFIASTTMERWRLVDELNGTFEYIGNEPFDGEITFDFTALSSGGSQDFRFRWQIDTGSGFADLPDDVESLVNVGSDAQSVSKTFPLAMNKGDRIKPEITRNAGSSGITTTYATIYASQ